MLLAISRNSALGMEVREHGLISQAHLTLSPRFLTSERRGYLPSLQQCSCAFLFSSLSVGYSDRLAGA